MRTPYFGIYFRRIMTMAFLCVCTLCALALGAGATEPACPKLDSPTSVAWEYQLFAAFTTGYDGYQMPCEMKCFSKENCTKSCQAKKGLEYLEKQMMTMIDRNQGVHCPSLTLNCLKQCKGLGADCARVCEAESLAKASN